MTTWHLGTIGFAYKAWQGLFYPPWLESQNYLSAYGDIFNAVEMDSTFYAVPRPELVSRWAARMPDGFKVCPKTPRAISHEFQLPQAIGRMLDFLQAMRGFGQKLGPVLLQWPPTFTAGAMAGLDEFLAALPHDIRYAVEFRHTSWDTPETLDLLSRYRVALVAVDYVHSPRQIKPSADFLYIRWLGEHGRFERGSHARQDVSAGLAWWRDSLRDLQDDVTAIYGFFNDDFSGHAPEACNQFKELVGLPVTYPQFPKQGTLF